MIRNDPDAFVDMNRLETIVGMLATRFKVIQPRFMAQQSIHTGNPSGHRRHLVASESGPVVC